MHLLSILKSAEGDGSSKGSGGAQTVLARQIDWIARRHEVSLTIVSDGSLHPSVEALARDVVRVPMSLSNFPGLASSLHRTMVQAKPDIILSEGPIPVDFAACLAAERARLPCLVRRHVLLADAHLPKWKKAIYGVLDVATRKKAASMIYLFPDQAARDGAPSAIIVPNGVDVDRFSPIGGIPKSLSHDRPRIGMVAQFVDAKNWSFFFRIVEGLAVLHPGIEVVCVGDGPLRPTLERAVASGPFRAHVSFAGQVDDVVPILQGLDLFVLTSRREGLSMSCLEAMACGVPVLTTPTSGSDLLAATGGAALIAHDEVASAVTAAHAILSNADRHAAMARAAREGVMESFALPSGAKALLAALEGARE